MTYEIREVRTPRGVMTWTVVAYDGDRPLGGDLHWYTHDLAVIAMRHYESGRLVHGQATESDHLLANSPPCAEHRAVQP